MPAIHSLRSVLELPGLTTAAIACGLLACGEKSSQAPATGEGDPSASVAEKVEKAADEAIEQAGGARLFDPEDKALPKRACEFLTADMVSATFGVPAGELKQRQLMGCMYTWQKDDQILDAKVMLIRVHRTLEGATTWFDGATATRTKAELDAQMDAVKGQVKKREELDTKLKKKTATDIAELAKMGSPDEGVSYEDVPGLADAARVSSADGVVWVRLGNVTFQVSGYKGPAQPKLEIDPKNLKGIAARAMAAQKVWIKQTLDQRKQGALKLAPAVVKAISAG